MAYATMTKKRQRIFDGIVQNIVSQHCSGIEINILDIPKVFNAAITAFDSGANHDELVRVVSEKYRELAKGA